MIEFVKNSALLGAHTLKFDYNYGSEPNIWELAGRRESGLCVKKSKWSKIVFSSAQAEILRQ